MISYCYDGSKKGLKKDGILELKSLRSSLKCPMSAHELMYFGGVIAY